MKKKTTLTLTFFLFYLINYTASNAQGSVTPSEWLEIAFEDATGAKDTVVIGHYNDTCYYAACPAIVSPGIDTAFGEVNLGPPTTPGFAARVENLVQDGAPYNMWTKRDIRMCDTTAEYALFYNFFNDPLFHYIRFYNYTLPIIATITINRAGDFLPDSADKGCFCAYNSDYWIFPGNPNERYGNGWAREYRDSVNNAGILWQYDAVISPNLIDTINPATLQYYVFVPNFVIVDAVQYNEKNPQIKIFPLPASTFLNVQTALNGILRYEIYSSKGDKIDTGVIANDKININKLRGGFYTLLIYINTEKLTYKFIKL